MSENIKYKEEITSIRTESLFIILTLIFFSLTYIQVYMGIYDLFTIIFSLVCVFFLFYCLNYYKLTITIYNKKIILKFGIFTRSVQLSNIEKYYLDDVSMWRIGGAGIHFSQIHGRYRMMFNFLEYPRLVLHFKNYKRVGAIMFTVKDPEKVMDIIKEHIQ